MRKWVLLLYLLSPGVVDAAEVWQVTPSPLIQDVAQAYALTDYRIRTFPEVRVDFRLTAMMATGDCARDSRGDCQTIGVAYTGNDAINFINYVNTADFSTSPMYRQIMAQLKNQGYLPPGNIIGKPGISTLTPTNTPTETYTATATETATGTVTETPKPTIIPRPSATAAVTPTVGAATMGE